MTRIYDISLTISDDLPVWPGDKEIEIVSEFLLRNGDVCNLSHFAMSMHAGTHIDVPLHFIENGKDTENIELDKFMGKAKVYELDVPCEISIMDIGKLEINEHDMVLFKIKRNSVFMKSNFFHKNFVSLSQEAAEYLVNKRVKAVGINYFSIEKFNLPGNTVHKTLLGGGVIIIEGLNLQEIDPGDYQLICLPLKFKNGNGSPVRAVLIKE